ncbi:hypothetical protein SRS16CHR_00317 [Variovorax sp. SRS16]|uniref:DUF4148 domain-containing protein n=1 Tax=Variovorax sp. SRS16 TaxID=282217 RepID=UPI001315F8E8|nr:DUF4148 domain-containing protein [Variovorax sp. SRS16]VTU13078.1 hypothetical protein SRS16CHR_00317 [Variovorax sp. SRS16]
MKTSYILAAAALSVLAAAGAQAETYQGVQTSVSAKSRTEVNEEAVRSASAPNQNVVRGSRGAEPFKSVADPAAVRAQAIATANAPDQNVVGGSRVNSRVISTMARPAEVRVQAQEGATTAK